MEKFIVVALESRAEHVVSDTASDLDEATTLAKEYVDNNALPCFVYRLVASARPSVAITEEVE